MDNKLEEAVLKNSVDFCTKEIIEPVLKSVLGFVDMECIAVFTAELADFFDEYLPDYFESDHKNFIGEHFYFSLYGESLPIELFKEIVMSEHSNEGDTDELDERPMSNTFSGLQVYFSSKEESLKDYIDDQSIKENRFYFDAVQDVLITQVLKYLNSNNK